MSTETEIKPTNNYSVKKAYKTCPLTVPIVTREIRCTSSSAGPLNYYERLSNKRVVGMECAYKLRRGFLETRCVFDQCDDYELKCPLVDSEEIIEFIKNQKGPEQIKFFGKTFRIDNPGR